MMTAQEIGMIILALGMINILANVGTTILTLFMPLFSVVLVEEDMVNI